jgi:hypothetical protein
VARYDRTIPPGEQGKITLELRTKNYKGKIHKTAKVVSNDPKTPEMTIEIAGKLWVPIHISNERVTLRGMVGEEITNTIILKGQKQEPLKLKISSISVPDKVAVQLHRREKDGGYLLFVSNKLKQEGFYVGDVKLATNYPDEPEIRIQVMGAIMSVLYVRPKVVNFGRVSEKGLKEIKSSGDFFMTRPIMVYLTEGNNLKIKKVEFEKSFFTVTNQELEPGKRYQLFIKPILDELSKGQNNDLLRIHTNQKDNDMLEIPVHLNILD